jgi:hypothetical protein
MSPTRALVNTGAVWHSYANVFNSPPSTRRLTHRCLAGCGHWRHRKSGFQTLYEIVHARHGVSPGSIADRLKKPEMSCARIRRLVLTTICAVIAGCGEAQQPESMKTVAAFEVPLSTEADRDLFLSVLRAAAGVEGMHVDAASKEDLEREAKVNPNFEMTMNAAVWRGSNDDEVVASAMDQFDHLGQVWLTFSRGKDPAIAARFRERAMHGIMLHWPSTLSLPIMPTGAIPLHRDLTRTPTGYMVKPSEAHKYERTGRESRPQ